MVLALYLDNVLPKEHGVKQPFYYFLTKKYWVGEGNRNVSDERKALLGEVHDQEISRNDNFEEVGDIVRELEKDNNCLQVNNLTKVYPNGKWAVDDLSITMYKDQIFALLGHNGAGKTSTMNMLTGMHPPTSGQAFAFGKSIFN